MKLDTAVDSGKGRVEGAVRRNVPSFIMFKEQGCTSDSLSDKNKFRRLTLARLSNFALIVDLDFRAAISKRFQGGEA
jgi:hypothetical protein